MKNYRLVVKKVLDILTRTSASPELTKLERLDRMIATNNIVSPMNERKDPSGNEGV